MGRSINSVEQNQTNITESSLAPNRSLNAATGERRENTQDSKFFLKPLFSASTNFYVSTECDAMAALGETILQFNADSWLFIQSLNVATLNPS